MDAELTTQDGAVEIRSPLWHKLFAAPLVLLMCGLGVVSAIGFLCPQLLDSRPEKLPSIWERVVFLTYGPIVFGLGAVMSQPFFYRLRADHYGITESLGWKEKRVFWSDVDSFTMEPNSNQHSEARHHIEPVMRAADGTVLFKSASTVVVCDKATVERRRQFWQVVQSHLAGKERPYTPPPRIPSPYEGKSLAWKVKRIAALALVTLAFVGAWACVMSWAIAHPELPKWIAAFIGSSVLLVPYLIIIPLSIVQKRRLAKLRAELEDAANTST